MKAAKMLELQRKFFKAVTCCSNPGEARFRFITTIGGNDYTDFTGDNERATALDVKLKCFYMQNLSDKQRQKIGVSQEVTDILYISPLDLKKQTGAFDFPSYVRSAYAGLVITFAGRDFEVESIKDLEPMFNGDTATVVSYQINMKKVTRHQDIG